MNWPIFTLKNRVNIENRPSVAVNSIVNTYLPSGTVNSSNLTGRNLTDSPIASFNHRIIASIISCIAKSIKSCNYSHVRSENCKPNCLSFNNSNFNYKSNTFSVKAVLHFIMQVFGAMILFQISKTFWSSDNTSKVFSLHFCITWFKRNRGIPLF